MSRLPDAAHVHDILGREGWPAQLNQQGIAESFLRNRHGPCPICGGRDRFRFDNKRGRGDWICNVCGSGDGFKLVQLFLGCDFRTALKSVCASAGITGETPAPRPVARTPVPDGPVRPTPRITELLRTACDPADVPDVCAYLESRGLWPLPPGHRLRAHVAASYFDTETKSCLGRFPALIAPIADINGELVGAQVTWLKDGQKLEGHPARKTLGKLVGWNGCAVQLLPATGDTLGICEGVETGLSANALDDIPVWAALSAGQLAKFEPPPNVKRLRVYGDRDEAGMGAALKLLERVQGSVCVETRIPKPPCKDWNDVLMGGGK